MEKNFILKNMLSKSCIKLIELYFEKVEDIHVVKVLFGEVILKFDPNEVTESSIIDHFSELGFNVINDPDQIIVERIKIASIELIHFASNSNSLIRNSDYISERVQLPYDRISKVFSKVTGQTIEKYIILLKIEKSKEMMMDNSLTLSEIAYQLGYSSVQYLSAQFKKNTGYTVSEYKNQLNLGLNPLETLL